MPTLLKLGRKIINVDLVFEIEDYGDRMRIFYAVASSDTAGVQQPAYAEIDGAAAVHLRAWFEQNSVNLLPISDNFSAPLDDEDTTFTGQTHHVQNTSPQTRAGAAEPTLEDNAAAFYGTVRIQQMHGIGSHVQHTDTERDNS